SAAPMKRKPQRRLQPPQTLRRVRHRQRHRRKIPNQFRPSRNAATRNLKSLAIAMPSLTTRNRTRKACRARLSSRGSLVFPERVECGFDVVALRAQRLDLGTAANRFHALVDVAESRIALLNFFEVVHALTRVAELFVRLTELEIERQGFALADPF